MAMASRDIGRIAAIDESVMAVLVTAIHAGQSSAMRGGWVYIVTNRPNGTLYLGVTSDLSYRIWQHRSKAIEGFTKRYDLGRLVWYECFEDIRRHPERA